MNPFLHTIQTAGGSCYSGRCSPAVPPPATGRQSVLLWRALKASLPLSVVACMASPSASAASSNARAPKRAPQAVHAILQYLHNHPMTVSSVPMQYDAEPSVPLPNCIALLQPADVLPASNSGSSCTNSKGSAPPSLAADHLSRVIAGLLYAACGGLDRAHNAVTPLCWGNPIPGSPAAADAAYVHAIIHRQEGSCIGEFGSGFSNASYWYRAAGDYPVFPQLLQEAQQLAKGKEKCEAHMAKHGSSWQPHRFVGLCSEVATSKDPQLLSFCEDVMAAELKLVLEHCYSKF